MKKYSKEIEEQMLLFYKGLSEKERRHYASQEALKLTRGGKRYIGDLLRISQKTIRKGDRELLDPTLYAGIPKGMQRHKGGGRKKKN